MVHRHYIHPHKAWIPHLTAIIDWYSRCIVGWEADDTLDTRMVIQAVRKAFRIARPEILTSDQDASLPATNTRRFSGKITYVRSMDGKSRWADNIMIERWFRSFK